MLFDYEMRSQDCERQPTLPTFDGGEIKWDGTEYIDRAERGDMEAQLGLGDYYHDSDPDKAVEWYQKAADQGSAEALYLIAKTILQKESRRPEDMVRAERSLDEAAKQNDPDSQYLLAEMLREGDLFGTDERMAGLYLSAAQQGHIGAQFEIGICMQSADGTDTDPVEAAAWIKKAAEGGHTRAQYEIAECYANGDGVETDIEEALMWYRRAAKGGHHRAQFEAGRLLAGRPSHEDRKEDLSRIDCDNRQAVKLLSQAANAGIANAMFELGLLYREGSGVPQNDGEAYYYLSLAVALYSNIEEWRQARDLAAQNLGRAERRKIQERVAVDFPKFEDLAEASWD